MRTRYLRGRRTYDGSQLSSHWIYRTTGIAGDAAVAFRGPCDVEAAHVADVVDLLHGPGISGDDMLHLLAETFGGASLLEAVLRQRLLACMARELLQERVRHGARITRTGDDLYAGRRKLSISVATVTPVSQVVHFALNVTATGVPAGVRAAGLAELGVGPEALGKALLEAFARETRSAAEAACLVRGRP